MKNDPLISNSTLPPLRDSSTNVNPLASQNTGLGGVQKQTTYKPNSTVN